MHIPLITCYEPHKLDLIYFPHETTCIIYITKPGRVFKSTMETPLNWKFKQCDDR